MTSFVQPLKQTADRTWLTSMAHIIGGSLFIALSAQIAIPLPFTPIPLTMQTLAVLLVGAILGKKRGFLSVLLYLFEAAIGLPVLSSGMSGPLVLLGPKGGYLVGMAVQSYLIGWFYEQRTHRNFLTTFAITSLICAAQLLIGCAYLTLFVGVNLVFMMGLYPFIIGELLKAIAVTRIMMTRERIKL